MKFFIDITILISFVDKKIDDYRIGHTQ